jgi:large subunit ribosomal protein L4e
MKVNSISGKSLKTISLPKQFSEEVRNDLIKRAYNSIRSNTVQPQGVSPKAGMRHAVELKKRRRVYKSGMGVGRSRVPRKVMSHSGGMRFVFTGAQAPSTVGGRIAHPPRSEKVIKERMNKKERRKAIRSAITGSKVIIIENKFEELSKTKDVIKALKNNGLKIEAKKKLKKGAARLRGRGKSYSKGPLLITSKKCSLTKSGVNIPGVETVMVNELNVRLLAPGSKTGRPTIWSEDSIKRMSEEGLFL